MAHLFGAQGMDVLLLLVGLAAGVATILGGTFALRFENRIHLILGFSAGAVIGVALFDLLPEALELGRRAYDLANVTAVVAVGFVGYLVVDRAFLIASAGWKGARGHLGAGSLTLHSLLDGLGVGLGFQVSTGVGVVLAIAVLAHDFADGVNTVNVSLSATGDPKTARRWLIADAAAPMVGIGASRLLTLSQAHLALVMAAFAGFFLYIGASELIPDSHRRHPRAWTTAATVLGVMAIYLVIRLAAF